MRVAINALCLGPTQRGTGRYAHNLITGIGRLAQAGECDDLELEIFLPEAALGQLPLPDHRALRYHPVRVAPDGQMDVPDSSGSGPSPSALWDRIHLPRRLAALGADGCHGLGFCSLPVPRRRRSWALVSTIHGLEPFMVPESFEPSWVKFACEGIARSVNESDAVITVSAQVKDEVVERFEVAGDRVFAIPHGTDWIDSAAARGTVRADPPYAVWCGAIEARKNLAAVLAAWAELKRRHGRLLALRVVGSGAGAEVERMHRLARELGVAEEVTFCGYVSESVLRDTVAGAHVLVFSSRYEGFGLVALEAMACGTPVIAADVAVLHEVIGDSGLYVDPSDAHGLAATVTQLVKDPALHARLCERARKRAARFSLTAMAGSTLAVYRHLSRPGARPGQRDLGEGR